MGGVKGEPWTDPRTWITALAGTITLLQYFTSILEYWVLLALAALGIVATLVVLLLKRGEADEEEEHGGYGNIGVGEGDEPETIRDTFSDDDAEDEMQSESNNGGSKSNISVNEEQLDKTNNELSVKDSPGTFVAGGALTIEGNVTQNVGVSHEKHVELAEKHVETIAENKRLKEVMAEQIEEVITPSASSSPSFGDIELDWVEDIAKPFFKKSGDNEAEEGIDEQSVLFIGIGNEGNRTLTRAKHLTSDFPTLLVSRNKQLVGSCKLDSLHIEDENKSWGHLSKYISNQKLIIISACYYKHNRTVEQNARDIDYILSIINECRKAGAIILSICSESVFVGEKIPVIEKELIKTYQDSLDIPSHSTIFINQNNLLNYVPNLPIDETYTLHDQLICEIIIGMFEASKADEVLGGDFSDVLTFLSHSMGPLRWFHGESERGEEEVLTEALNHPLCELLNDSNEYPFNNVTSMLALITGGPYFTMGDAFDLLKEIKKNAPNSTLIYSINQHTAFDDSVRLQLFLNYEHIEPGDEEVNFVWNYGDAFKHLRSRDRMARIDWDENKGVFDIYKSPTLGLKPDEEGQDAFLPRGRYYYDRNTELWIQDNMDSPLDQEE